MPIIGPTIVAGCALRLIDVSAVLGELDIDAEGRAELEAASKLLLKQLDDDEALIDLSLVVCDRMAAVIERIRGDRPLEILLDAKAAVELNRSILFANWHKWCEAESACELALSLRRESADGDSVHCVIFALAAAWDMSLSWRRYTPTSDSPPLGDLSAKLRTESAHRRQLAACAPSVASSQADIIGRKHLQIAEQYQEDSGDASDRLMQDAERKCSDGAIFPITDTKPENPECIVAELRLGIAALEDVDEAYDSLYPQDRIAPLLQVLGSKVLVTTEDGWLVAPRHDLLESAYVDLAMRTHDSEVAKVAEAILRNRLNECREYLRIVENDVSLQKELSHAHLALGRLWHRYGDFDRAVVCYRNAVDGHLQVVSTEIDAKACVGGVLCDSARLAIDTLNLDQARLLYHHTDRALTQVDVHPVAEHFLSFVADGRKRINEIETSDKHAGKPTTKAEGNQPDVPKGRIQSELDKIIEAASSLVRLGAGSALVRLGERMDGQPLISAGFVLRLLGAASGVLALLGAIDYFLLTGVIAPPLLGLAALCLVPIPFVSLYLKAVKGHNVR